MRFGGLIRAWGALIRHGAGLLRGIDMRLSAVARHPLVRWYWQLWRWHWAAMLLLLWFVVISLNLPEPQEGRQWSGPIWNYANATTVLYDYTNRSIRNVIWNSINPTPCTTWTGPAFRADGTPNLPPAPWNSPNPIPECWDCHGAHQWGYVNYTGMAHDGGAPVLYGK